MRRRHIPDSFVIAPLVVKLDELRQHPHTTGRRWSTPAGLTLLTAFRGTARPSHSSAGDAKLLLWMSEFILPA